jgi:serine/threonine protein kinase
MGKSYINPSMVLEIWCQLIRSLENVHRMGYTHNNIKPGNIMIDWTTNGENRIRATLIDFGFARKFL